MGKCVSGGRRERKMRGKAAGQYGCKEGASPPSNTSPSRALYQSNLRSSNPNPGSGAAAPDSLCFVPSCSSVARQYMSIWSTRTTLRRAAPAKPQKMSGSLTSCLVVKRRARQPRSALNTANADRLPVERLVWFSRIWGALESNDRGMVHACRMATGVSAANAGLTDRHGAERLVPQVQAGDGDDGGSDGDTAARCGRRGGEGPTEARVGRALGGRVVQDHQGDDNVLNGDEEVLAVRREGKVGARRVRQRDGVCGSLKDLRGQHLVSTAYTRRRRATGRAQSGSGQSS